MALELQSQAMGALQSVAGVALSLRSYKEHKDNKAKSEVNTKNLESKTALNNAKAKALEIETSDEKAYLQKMRSETRDRNSLSRQRNFNIQQQKLALKTSQSSEDAAAVAEAALSDRTMAIDPKLRGGTV